MLCGYLDRVVTFQGSAWITDWKTSKYSLDEKYFQKYSPDPQMSQYTLAGIMILGTPISGIIIDAAQLGVTFSRFQRGQTTRTVPQLEEWLGDTMMAIKLNESYVQADYWPQNDTACDKYGGCIYRTVCSASPDLRPRLLTGLFHQRSWDPLVVREI